MQAAQTSSSASAAGGAFQSQASNSAGGISAGAAQGQQGVPTNTAASTQTPGRPPATMAGASTTCSGGPGQAGSSDFVKEEIIELQEMRLSPIPSIRNRFAGNNSKVEKFKLLENVIYMAFNYSFLRVRYFNKH